MPRKTKTWTEKMATKPPHSVVLEADFAGVPKGAKLYISSPTDIAQELANVPPGTTLSMQAFRKKLAEKNKCDAACPVSTSIFLKIVAEHTWEVYNQTGSTKNLPPFWRVVEPTSPLAKKLSFDPAWIGVQRELET